jgi:hypothetical protein
LLTEVIVKRGWLNPLGRKEGIKDGSDEGIVDGFEDSFVDGFDDGSEDGFADSIADGFDDGIVLGDVFDDGVLLGVWKSMKYRFLSLCQHNFKVSISCIT